MVFNSIMIIIYNNSDFQKSTSSPFHKLGPHSMCELCTLVQFERLIDHSISEIFVLLSILLSKNIFLKNREKQKKKRYLLFSSLRKKSNVSILQAILCRSVSVALLKPRG